jgi:hypothetical protein
LKKKNLPQNFEEKISSAKIIESKKVTDVDHGLDLALFAIEEGQGDEEDINKGFWDLLMGEDGKGSLDFTQYRFPRLYEDVLLAGFPLGGTSVSVTRGVVSRVDQRAPFSDESLTVG